MTMKNDSKFEEELTCHLKIDMRNFTNFAISRPEHLEVSKKIDFNVLLLSKVYIV